MAGVTTLGDDLLADAAKSGIDLQFAADLIKEELRKAQEKEKVLYDYYQQHPEEAAEYGHYWGERCINLAKQPETGRFIRLPSE
jgi:hypothetical protein